MSICLNTTFTDEQSFKEFFHSTSRKVMYWAKKTFKRLPSDEIEDLVATGYACLWNQREGHYKNHLAVLYQIIKNRAINYLIHKKYRVEYEESLVEQRIDPIIVEAEALDKIYIQIERLPEKCRKVFKMLYIEDKTIREVAEELGLNIQTVWNHKANAINILKKALSGEQASKSEKQKSSVLADV